MKKERRPAATAVVAEGTEGEGSWCAAIDRSPLAVVLVDAEAFSIRAMSRAFGELIGGAADEAVGQPLPALFPDGAAERLRAALLSARDTDLVAFATDLAYAHPALGQVQLDCSAWSFPDGDGRDGVAMHVSMRAGEAVNLERLAVLSDQIRAANAQLLMSGIRQLELAEQADEHARRIDRLLESQAGGVLVLDATGQVVSISPHARQLLDLPEIDDPDFERRLRELKLRRPDGSPLPLAEGPIQRVAAGLAFSDLEFELARDDGTSVRLAFNGSAIEDSDAAGVSLAILVFYEVTARRKAEELRSDHISLIAHDLRSPLTSILGYTELVGLMIRSEAGDKAAEWTQRIGVAARQMAGMIDDLVESTRLESGSLQLRKDPAFLRALVLNVVAQNPSPEARARINVETVDDPARVWVDQKRLERVITNLISNALKYSPADAPVTVRLALGAGELVLSVADRGPGLSPETIPRLFQRFYRADPTSRVEGMGLGLYIARLIVEAHGGRIWVESELGKGSTFLVALPLQ